MIESLGIKKELLQLLVKNKIHTHKDKSFILNLPLFKNNNHEFTFKEGINVIYAENGAGKSVLMNLISTVLACHQGGKSLFTNTWLREETEDFLSYSVGSYEPNLSQYGLSYSSSCTSSSVVIVKARHDAQTAYYCDPRRLRGLSHGGAAFDYDFFDLLRADSEEKSSTGKKNKSRMSDIVGILKGEVEITPSRIDYIKKSDDGKYLKERLEESPANKQLFELVSPSIPFGAKTLLMDEPENALDFYSQRELFKLLKKNEDRKDIQVIMISHSPLVFGLNNVNFITDDPKKLEEQIQLVKNGDFFNLTK